MKKRLAAALLIALLGAGGTSVAAQAGGTCNGNDRSAHCDLDGDGTINKDDADADGDGVPNEEDVCERDASNTCEEEGGEDPGEPGLPALPELPVPVPDLPAPPSDLPAPPSDLPGLPA